MITSMCVCFFLSSVYFPKQNPAVHLPCAGHKAGSRSFTECGQQLVYSQGVGHNLKGAQPPPNGSLSGALGSGGAGIADRKVTREYSVGFTCVSTPAVLKNPWPDPQASLPRSLLPAAAHAIFPRIPGLDAHWPPGGVPSRLWD